MEKNITKDFISFNLWDNRISSYNVTFFCDDLIEKYGQGTIMIETETKAISWRNIDYQSSGFELIRIDHQYSPEGYAETAKFFLRTDPQKIRKHLYIPRELGQGFCWEMDMDDVRQLHYPNYQLSQDLMKDYKAVPTEQFGQSYILSFSVCGEFGLSASFIPKPSFLGLSKRPILIFERSFCCK